MVDDNRTVPELLDRARPLRVDVAALATLERAGLIAKRFSAPSAAESEAASAPRSETEVQQLLAAQQQLGNAIKQQLGVRGYLIMIRLQRANRYSLLVRGPQHYLAQEMPAISDHDPTKRVPISPPAGICAPAWSRRCAEGM